MVTQLSIQIDHNFFLSLQNKSWFYTRNPDWEIEAGGYSLSIYLSICLSLYFVSIYLSVIVLPAPLSLSLSLSCEKTRRDVPSNLPAFSATKIYPEFPYFSPGLIHETILYQMLSVLFLKTGRCCVLWRCLKCVNVCKSYPSCFS